MKQQVEVKELKEGKYVIIDDEPCIIKGLSKSKPGKHGSAKARIDAVGIFDGQKRSIVSSVSSKTFVPIVERKSAQVLSVSGDIAQLMDMEDYSTFEMKIPDEYKDRVNEGGDISYITAMGKMKIDLR
ncbi:MULTISPECIES: translation initiation factor IF-5A [Methanohalophilus]|jgi:translation initiation factor 5A|uniref:Translation initiation factor 5A n=3 Tax=Methanohalophilus TaxID=2175 RepID=A0A1L3Q1X1_9EURY|nr:MULTISPECIES: translation initiation factor IF-5A [Methanohalophilus]APH38791.1 translation initiation factor IF-5A [Methanohalophilus halophilus]ATU07379.1 translation initiation factor IF-5A [Methanohalophilus portucalensis]OJH48571.1 translation initiation factor 5A precursor (eIF-5A) [Methanohalophilus portucalensis FDF-1]RNI07985.1 translation initiation factor IF-5A [Methanohalophilus halophilus]RNI09474.1 translation initiation factor IF-5A [Methanohalophilus portucalensis FDF-1]